MSGGREAGSGGRLVGMESMDPLTDKVHARYLSLEGDLR